MKKHFAIGFLFTCISIIGYSQNGQYNLENLKYYLGEMKSYGYYSKEQLQSLSTEKAGKNFLQDSLAIINLLHQIDSLADLALSRSENIIVPEEVKDGQSTEVPTVPEVPEVPEYKSDIENDEGTGNQLIDQMNPLRKMKTRFIIEVGVNNISTSSASGFTNAEINTGKSWFWNYGLYKPIVKTKSIDLETGISYLSNRYTFENDVRLVKGVNFSTFQAINSSEDPCLRTGHITIPLNLKVNLSKGFYINVGAYGGYRVYTSQIVKLKVNKEEIVEQRYDSYGLNNWLYGFKAGVGYKKMDVFLNYNLSNLFKSKINYEYHPFMIGTRFSI